jgi:hypothetical protein
MVTKSPSLAAMLRELEKGPATGLALQRATRLSSTRYALELLLRARKKGLVHIHCWMTGKTRGKRAVFVLGPGTDAPNLRKGKSNAEKCAEYYRRNKLRMLANQREYYQGHKKQVLARARAWEKANPDRVKELKRQRNAKLRALKQSRRQWSFLGSKSSQESTT